eukprot:1361651-Amorphochlora_amoeboformis.AAC.1
MEVSVDSFVSSSLPITNREYLQFVTDGGYQRPEFWLRCFAFRERTDRELERVRVREREV